MHGILGGKAAGTLVAIIRMCSKGDDAHRLTLRLPSQGRERQGSKSTREARRVTHKAFEKHFSHRMQHFHFHGTDYISVACIYCGYFGASSRIASAFGSQ